MQCSTPEQKIRMLEKKILGRFELDSQVFDLDEIISLFNDKTDKLLVWNAAMNLVEQERVGLIQIKTRTGGGSGSIKWILIENPNFDELGTNLNTWVTPSSISILEN